MITVEELETIAEEILGIFEIYAAPVPIETMLQNPKDGLWEELDPTQLSATFISLRDRYSPRMSLARMLVRHIAQSEWGIERGLDASQFDRDLIAHFARMIIMPRDIVLNLRGSAMNPATMSLHFEVPEDEASQRITELL